MWMYYVIVHDILSKMIEWYIGVTVSFSLSFDMKGKYYKEYLSQEIYEMYKKTYSDSSYENLWNALFKAFELFRRLAEVVAQRLGYSYCYLEDANMRKYLKK